MNDYQSLNDPLLERHLVQNRVFVVLLLVTLLIVLLVVRYYVLQIQQHERYATLSDENRVHVRSVPPTRGLIYDRNGVVIAENLPSYTLSIVRERTADVDKLLQQLDEILELSDSEMERFEKQIKQHRRPYEGVPLRFRLTEEEVAQLAVNEHALPGIEVEVELIRHYPMGEIFAHTLGYVGRINEIEQSKLDADRYEGTHVVGKIGIEKEYEDLLLGEVGYEHVETDARGYVERVLEREDPIQGQNLWLHLDVRLQQKLYELLGNNRASVVAIDIKTGGVLAMASTPSFDPNLFVTGISSRDYNRLLKDPDKPLYDRSIYGQYPPGSTVKPLYGLAGLASGVVTPSFSVADVGFFQLPNREHRYRDWKKEGHGQVDLRIAIQQSCDVYFYEMGYKAGIDVLSDYGHMFGLGQSTGIDLPSERTGVMPSREWKRTRRGASWFPGDTINASIGQGFTLATPLQLAKMTTVLARRGVSIPPKLLRSVGDSDAQIDTPVSEIIQIEKRYWDLVQKGMEDVMHSPRGTAYQAGLGAEYRIAGKTGTAQVVGIDQDAEYDSESLEIRKRDHALFVAFAPSDKPSIAVSVIVENGEHGSSTAAPIARALMDEWHQLSLADDARGIEAEKGAEVQVSTSQPSETAKEEARGI